MTILALVGGIAFGAGNIGLLVNIAGRLGRIEATFSSIQGRMDKHGDRIAVLEGRQAKGRHHGIFQKA